MRLKPQIPIAAKSATTGNLFIRDPVASIARPVLELKGVRRIALGPGERGNLTWALPVSTLTFLSTDLHPVLEPGVFEIHVGQSADPSGFLSGSIELMP